MTWAHDRGGDLPVPPRAGVTWGHGRCRGPGGRPAAAPVPSGRFPDRTLQRSGRRKLAESWCDEWRPGRHGGAGAAGFASRVGRGAPIPCAPVTPVSPTYRVALGVCAAVVRGWGQLEVSGLEALPATGPVLLAANHDSYWDPPTIGLAAMPRRQLHALAKDSLWRVPGLGAILDGMGQIPVRRGTGDIAALDRALAALREGAAVGIFLEGTRSLGRPLRAHSGFGRMAAAVPEAQVVCCAVSGTVDVARFPTRPRIRVRFFAPSDGAARAGERPGALGARLLEELRREAPRARAGRSY